MAVFARPAVPGRVKTRLSPSLPADLATRLYAAMLADTLETASRAQAERRAIYWSEALSADPPPGFEAREQRGAELGARLAAAFEELLAAPGDRAVIVGADCPDLAVAGFAGAFRALEDHDVALGPARDGGYWLIGLRRPAPALFEGVAWSSDRVLDQTRERAAGAGLTVATLEVLEDLDTPGDLVRLIARRAVADGATSHLDEALRLAGLLPPRS